MKTLQLGDDAVCAKPRLNQFWRIEMLKKFLIIPAIVLMSQGVFAGEGRSPRPQQPEQGYDEPQPGYQGQGYQEQYYGGVQGGGCCGAVLPPPVIVAPCCNVYPPPPPLPPVVYNPGINYYCGMPNCGGNIQPPYGPPMRPWGPRPTPYGGYGQRYGQGYGPRPSPYGTMPRGQIAGIPGGMVRPMSGAGCEVQQGNSGEFSVISAEGQLLYKSSIPHAAENAEFMKAHYEKNSDLCGGVRSPAKSLDI